VDYKTLNASVIIEKNFSQHILKHKIEENLNSMDYKLQDFSLTDNISPIGELKSKLGKPSYLLSYSLEGDSIDIKQVIGGLQSIKLES